MPNHFQWIISLGLLLLIALPACKTEPPGNDTMADKITFEVPAALTGSPGRAMDTRAVSEGTRTTLNGFFNYARFQVAFAAWWADAVKQLIAALEAHDVFTAPDSFTAELGGANAGDKIRWTVADNDVYLLEWWKKQLDNSFAKFVELDFDYYTRENGYITVRGRGIVDTTANPDFVTPLDGFSRNADWVSIAFDSARAASDGAAWMEIAATGFLHETVVPAELGLPAGTFQNFIMVLTRDPTGEVSLSGSTSVPGTSQLTYLAGEYEKRYYVYTGRGSLQAATMNLAMPLNTYPAATVFSTFENNTIGGVVAEYIADLLRADGSLGGYAGHEILDNLNFTAQEPYDNTTPRPATTEIRTAINQLGAGVVGEDLYTLMNVINPVYSDESGYLDFGTNCPEICPPAGTLPLAAEIISQAEVDGLVIGFADGGDEPGF